MKLSAMIAAVCTVLTACASHKQQTTSPATPRPANGAAPAVTPTPGMQDSAQARAPGAPQPRPYSRVITPNAKTSRGLFATHQVGDRLYFEIPARELDKDMLLVRRNTAVSGFSFSTDRVIRWSRIGNRIYLRQQSYRVVADSTRAIYRAVREQELGPIIASFNVEAYGPDSAAVIEATRLYTTNVTEFAAVNGVAADRSFVERVAAFPENIEIDATQTGSTAPTLGPIPVPVPIPGAESAPRGTQTVRAHWSMLRLPERPMMPRLRDKRVGYLSTEVIDYSRPEHEAVTRSYIHRFRLEKKDPAAAVSDPVKPIVFYIDPATPEWLVPWIKRGVEAWRGAFADAGFSNAIFAKEIPSETEEPNFSLLDARHSVIYWRPSTVANATGGQVVDPRTGEIIKAEVNMFHNIMELQRNWYFVQAAPLDVRAQHLPMPDSLMGRLVQYVVTHEVGHAIGFPHNMKSSSEYPADSLRSRTFLQRMGGHVATLMDYSRFNYVAQPEDSVPPELLIPNVGPYDRFAIMWGHTPIPGATTPDAELPTLDRWSRMQDTIPWFRFSTEDATNDPGDLTEAVGDADAVKSSALGLRNLQRVSTMLLPAAEQPGRDYTVLNDLYGEMVVQWGRYMGHVAAVVGGAESQEKYGTGVRFTPLSRQRQREAVDFLARNAFTAPAYVRDPNILRRIESEGVIARIRSAQGSVLNTLLSERRLNRLIEYEALAPRPNQAYTIADLMGDLRRGAWTEIYQPGVRIDVYRRNLQRAYLEAVERIIKPGPVAVTTTLSQGMLIPAPRYNSDVRAVLRGALVELDRDVSAAIPRAADAMTRLHLRDVRLEIQRLLDPKER